MLCCCVAREGSCLSCHELLSPKQGLELFRLGAVESSSMHSLAWNLWPGLDHGGLPHGYTHRLLPTPSLIPPRHVTCLGAPLPMPGVQERLPSWRMRICADDFRIAPLRMHPRRKRKRRSKGKKKKKGTKVRPQRFTREWINKTSWGTSQYNFYVPLRPPYVPLLFLQQCQVQIDDPLVKANPSSATSHSAFKIRLCQ